MVIQTSAQDTQFSQAYASPLSLNPALTGFFDGGYRMNVNYRSQWRSTVENQLKTSAFGGELNFENNGLGNSKFPDMFGLGILFYSDRVSVFDLNTNQISVSLAYHKSLSRKRMQYISVGANFGVQQRNINYEDLSFQDQFNGINAFDLASAERLPGNNFGRADMSIGLNYTYKPSKNASVFAGASWQHFLEPENSFYQDVLFVSSGQVISDTYHSKLVGHLSMDLMMSEVMSFIPRVIVTTQGSHQQMYIGPMFEYRLLRSEGTSLQFGMMAKAVNDIDKTTLNQAIVILGIQFNELAFGFSYDANLRNFTDGINKPSSFEFSIRYTGDYDNEDNYCPSF